jgi:hypothetical protein
MTREQFDKILALTSEVDSRPKNIDLAVGLPYTASMTKQQCIDQFVAEMGKRLSLRDLDYVAHLDGSVEFAFSQDISHCLTADEFFHFMRRVYEAQIKYRQSRYNYEND